MRNEIKNDPAMESHTLRAILRVVLPYVVFAFLWIFISDRFLDFLQMDDAAQTQWSIYKGWGFVIITALLLSILLHTELKRLEEIRTEYSRSEERLRLLGDNLPDSYVYQCIQDTGGVPRFRYLSAGVEKIHGLKAGDVLADAMLLRRQISPESATALMKAESSSLRDLTDFTMEVRMQRSDGQWRWMKLRSRPRRSSTGIVVWDGVATDITERKRMEERLQESERKYRELVEHANSIILRWTNAGKINFLNEYGLRFFGYTAEEIIGRHVIGTIVPITDSGGQDLKQLMDQICADPMAFEQNINENMRSNGERVWIAWTNRIDWDAQGRILEILSVGTDITELKHAEEAIRHSEEQFRLIMENLADLVAVLDLEGRRIYNSPSYQSILGDPEILRGSSSFEQIHPEDRDRVRQSFLGTVQTGVGQRLDYRMIGQDGKIRNIESQGSVIRDVRGHVAQVLVVSRDVTARRQAEKAIRELNASLEQRVAERTAELAVARDRAEAADRLKSAFLATMSHELRTPLNSIIGFTGIILQGLTGPLNAEQSKQLEMVRGSARHLLALINDVLDISKIEAGQLEVMHESFDLRTSVEKVVGIIRPLAEKKGLAFRVDIGPDIDVWESDQRRIEQIMINLLNNAIKFTEYGHVSLTAAVQSGVLGLSVADTGIGIRPGDMQKLFQPFRQIDTGLSRQHEGTGLGLAICRRLADLLGGEIRSESEWGKGSVFTFLLPGK